MHTLPNIYYYFYWFNSELCNIIILYKTKSNITLYLFSYQSSFHTHTEKWFIIEDCNCRFSIICKYYQERQVRRQAQYKRKRSESEEEEEDGDDNDPNEVWYFYLSLSVA